MSIKDIASLGKLLGQFLALFSTCFTRSTGRRLLRIYVQGLLSDVQRKNVEAMAVEQNVAPRTLQLRQDRELPQRGCCIVQQR